MTFDDFAFDPIVVALVAAALLAGVALAAWFGGRRRAALILMQPLAAALLLAALSLRDVPRGDTLVVLAPGADPADIDIAPHVARVAVPGAPQADDAVRVPDLAAALRRHPARHLVVFGDGLRAHDRAAVGTRSLDFRASPESSQPAIVELDVPDGVRAGSWWTLRGRVRAASGMALVLLDPAGAKVAEAAPGEDGRFALEAVARAAGAAEFELQLRRGDDVLQTLPVPLLAHAPPPLRALVLAGAPSPELKYLRRWALDAGVQLDTRIALAPGLAQRRGEASLDAAQLAELDLLIVDERSWSQLSALQPGLRAAVAEGLGLLVRTTGPVPERVAREWAEWGIAVPSAGVPRAVRLAVAPQIELHAWPAEVDAAQPALGSSPTVDLVAASTDASANDGRGAAPSGASAHDGAGAAATGSSTLDGAGATASGSSAHDGAGATASDSSAHGGAGATQAGSSANAASGATAAAPSAANSAAQTVARPSSPATWHAQGRGRVGAWRLTDTHRLYTRGERERHATLWSETFATLARARGERAPRLPSRALVGERAVVCGLTSEAVIVAPSGRSIALASENGCAALWPRESGWHRLESEDREHRFHVQDPAALAPLLVHERRAATQALAGGEAPTVEPPMDRDRWRAGLLAAWLAAMALAWWLERRVRSVVAMGGLEPPTPAL